MRVGRAVSITLGIALVGAVIGLGATAIVGRMLDSLLFGVTSSDPLTLTGVACVLVGVAVLACYLPARRAARVDPLVALRVD